MHIHLLANCSARAIALRKDLLITEFHNSKRKNDF